MKKKLIFISGTGRSGTHLLGRTISSHPDLIGRIEQASTFKLITKIATTQDFSNPIYINALKWILKIQLQLIVKKGKSHILEKSHPSIWLFEYLLNSFTNVYFIGVWRDVEPTVSSMLEHKGVLAWYDKLPQYKQNRFLGIDKSNNEEFSNLSLEEKCAFRWLSHKKELFRVKEKYPSNIILIKYDDFLLNPTPSLTEISSFLEISNQFSTETFNVDSLNKWQKKLSENQIKKIRKVIANKN